jgi:predicted RNA polymerase sigma factor
LAGTTETHHAIEAVWRIESARLIASLTRIVRDVARAEELAQDALVAALEQWPQSGIPDNPGAWLMATAKHRALDYFRRVALISRKQQELGRDLTEKENAVPDPAAAIDDNVGDDLLRLVFIACHPVLSMEALAALTLRLLGGLSTSEIARAYLSTEPTIAQRIGCKTDSRRSAHSVRSSPRTRVRSAARLRAAGRLPHLQRGLLRYRW